ncbi:MAG: phosphomannomutase/phosphoglucomutase, partial [Campylobacterales bacterium]|nr:phosphomannomutase/phosphoglucomutase [Campylobacterales bacterium]
SGCHVLDMGMVATPINYFANYNRPKEIDNDINASIMITGSHNPSQYNGFKITIGKKPFFGEDIYALGDEIIANINLNIPTDTCTTFIDTRSEYIEYMVENFSHLKGLQKNIVIDCGNGVAGVAITEIFDRLDLRYKALFVNPDGTFPNHHPDPSEEENLEDIKKELEGDFDIGFAYDGDADRIAVLTKKQNIKGDILAILFAKNMTNPTVIGEVKCSSVMYDEIDKIGKAIMYKTGHSNLKVKMKETGADLAAEVSGHIFFNDRYFGFDDALYATLRVLELLNKGFNLDKEIALLPKLYSSDEIKIETSEEEKFKIIDILKEILKKQPDYLLQIKDIIDVDGLRINFEDGWALVRASNTTPMLITRFEASSLELTQRYKQDINTLILQAKEAL